MQAVLNLILLNATPVPCDFLFLHYAALHSVIEKTQAQLRAHPDLPDPAPMTGRIRARVK